MLIFGLGFAAASTAKLMMHPVHLTMQLQEAYYKKKSKVPKFRTCFKVVLQNQQGLEIIKRPFGYRFVYDSLNVGTVLGAYHFMKVFFSCCIIFLRGF